MALLILKLVGRLFLTKMFKERIKKIIGFLPKPIEKALVGLYRIPYKRVFLPIKKRNHNKKNLKKAWSCEDLRLELGSSEKKSGWFTVDLKEGADLIYDLTQPLPFPDESITEIHSEHFFEHLYINEIKSCLRECFRVLKCGGEISFSVPDFKRACETYLNKEKIFWLLPNPNWCKTKLDELNFLTYADGYHKFMFDEENGIERLKEAGFENCRVREHNPQKDNSHKRHESLYFVGYKLKHHA